MIVHQRILDAISTAKNGEAYPMAWGALMAIDTEYRAYDDPTKYQNAMRWAIDELHGALTRYHQQ